MALYIFKIHRLVHLTTKKNEYISFFKNQLACDGKGAQNETVTNKWTMLQMKNITIMNVEENN